ncbi:MarR family winged helix-turn-helix transcriptional regulator [Pseudomonas sp. HK3]
MNEVRESQKTLTSGSSHESQAGHLEHRIEEVLVALRRVIRATDLHSKHLVKTTGLTAPQILILQAIRNIGQVTIGEIAADVSLSQATVTTILDRLEKRGLVYRERSLTDKRKVHTHLTKLADEILLSAPIPLQDQLTRQFGDLKEWEQTMLISSLQRVAQMMDAHEIDAAPLLDVGALDRLSDAVDDDLYHYESDEIPLKRKTSSA